MQLLREYALSFLGVPYKWGGETPMGGVDCSGLVQLILRSVGLDPPGDQNAQALFNHFEKQGRYTATPMMGNLVFFGKSVLEITHVAFVMDQFRMIEAGGGDSLTMTISDAIEKGAYVKISMLNRRKDQVAMLRPSYTTIGVIA